MFVSVCRCVSRKWKAALRQNCVTYPPKPWGNTVIYGDTSTHIDVAEVVESEVRWWDLMCVSTARAESISKRAEFLPGSGWYTANAISAKQYPGGQADEVRIRYRDESGGDLVALKTASGNVANAFIGSLPMMVMEQQRISKQCRC